MNDPWEGIRHTLSVMPAQWLIPDPIMRFLMADGKKLLADADALREFQKEAHWLFGHEPPDDLGAYTHASRKTWIARRDAMFAALPPYLKGE